MILSGGGDDGSGNMVFVMVVVVIMMMVMIVVVVVVVVVVVTDTRCEIHILFPIHIILTFTDFFPRILPRQRVICTFYFSNLE